MSMCGLGSDLLDALALLNFQSANRYHWASASCIWLAVLCLRNLVLGSCSALERGWLCVWCGVLSTAQDILTVYDFCRQRWEIHGRSWFKNGLFSHSLGEGTWQAHDVERTFPIWYHKVVAPRYSNIQTRYGVGSRHVYSDHKRP